MKHTSPSFGPERARGAAIRRTRTWRVTRIATRAIVAAAALSAAGAVHAQAASGRSAADRDASGRGPSSSALAPGAALRIWHLELTQGIQDDSNRVQLLAQRPLVVRVYLQPVDESVTVRGRLTVGSAAGGTLTIPSESNTTVPAGGWPSLAAARGAIGASLNFVLPPSRVSAGAMRFGPIVLERDGQPVECMGCSAVRTRSVQASPMLEVTLVPVEYAIGDSSFLPLPADLDSIQQWLAVGLPVGVTRVQRHTPVFIDGLPSLMRWDADHPDSQPHACQLVNQRLRQVRESDIAAEGGDPMLSPVRYYGAVSNRKLLLRGCSPVIRVPIATWPASGPTGNESDSVRPANSDAGSRRSFSGWYAAHELAHLLGRDHLPSLDSEPESMGCRAPPPADRDWVDANGSASRVGRISGPLGPDDAWFGLRIELRAAGTVLTPLPGSEWNELMGYCRQLWTSGFTYRRLLNRLWDEQFTDAFSAGPGVATQLVAAAKNVAAPVQQANVPINIRPPRPSAAAPPTPTTAPVAATSAALTVVPPTAGVQPVAAQVLVAATVNLSKRSGKFDALDAVARAAALTPVSDTSVKIRVLSAGDSVLLDLPVAWHLLSTTSAGHDSMAVVSAAVQLPLGSRRLELVIRGLSVASRQVTSGEPRSLAPIGTLGTGRPVISAAPDDASRSASPVTITWRFTSGDVPGDDTQLTYRVLLSLDDQKTWQTIAVGLTASRLRIMPEQLENRHGYVWVRVVASNGFREAEQTNRIRVS